MLRKWLIIKGFPKKSVKNGPEMDQKWFPSWKAMDPPSLKYAAAISDLPSSDFGKARRSRSGLSTEAERVFRLC